MKGIFDISFFWIDWQLRISSTNFHLTIITRRNILDVASFYIAMLRIREHNSFVPESKSICLVERLYHSLRFSWSETGNQEREKDEVE